MTYCANTLIDLTRTGNNSTLAFSALASAHDLELEPFIGRCLVLDLSSSDRNSIHADELENAFIGLTPHYEARLQNLAHSKTLPARLLFKTARSANSWRYLNERSLALLFSKGIKLIGTDAPTLADPDQAESESSFASILLENGVSYLINLNLDNLGAIAQGILMAAPLIAGQSNGKYVRAVLLSQ
ncbi:MAG: cyclase family protein [Candidatus Obscuribacterales bacterium]|nr:cyclase family protein [Candidatus Obscuribacterales bacterium]